MKILVYDIAAEDGGGLFVLKNFYQQVLTYEAENVEWVFMTSLELLEETKDITVLSYAWVKKSWLHRWIFETCMLPILLKKINPDLVLSLQNMPIRYNKAEQMVYLHQSLQYCPKRFSFFKKEERSLAIRQKIICNIYKWHLRKADHIFVQTQWIKDATEKWIHIPEEKITVVPVTLGTVPELTTPYQGCENNLFFYPARGEVYKNHKVVIDACRILKNQGVNNYKVLFAMELSDNPYISWLKQEAAGLPIEFIGRMKYEDVWKQYNSSVLLFPSYLETCGLPLLEARTAGSMIVASDMPFSHEVLEDYENVQYFKYDSPEQLAEQMISIIEKRVKYVSPRAKENNQNPDDLLQNVLKQISHISRGL